MGERYLVVWDLDGTLGDFEALERPGAPDAAVRLRVRPGLADALNALCRAGFTHSLLTTATPLYAEVALRGAGLRHLLARAEGRGQRCKDAARRGGGRLAPRG